MSSFDSAHVGRPLPNRRSAAALDITYFTTSTSDKAAMTSTKPLKWGIIATGGISTKFAKARYQLWTAS